MAEQDPHEIVAEIMKETHIAILTYVDAQGRLVSTPMGTQDLDDPGRVHFITEADTDKMHAIAAKAVAFKIAATPEFKERQERTLLGASLLAERLTGADVADKGVSVLTGGTDVHLVLVDLRNSELDGQQAEDLLHEVGITVNRNAVPFDPRPPMVTSGLRIGTGALATRGFGEAEFTEVADIIATALATGQATDALKERVVKLAQSKPLYEGLEDWGLLG